MLLKKAKRKLGSRNLRAGSYGSDVAHLQQRLADLGYEPGPDNGQFGYLTQEALQYFQRDYRLRIDGIAGKEVFAVLLQEQLPVHRRVHVVERGESLAQIASGYDIGIEALQASNKKGDLYAGQKLIFFDRQVWGIQYADMMAQESFQRNQKLLTGVFKALALNQNITGISIVKGVPSIGMIRLPEGNQLLQAHKLMTSRRQKRECLQYLEKISHRFDGLYLPWDSFYRVDGSRYHKFVQRLRKVIGEKHLVIMFTPQMPSWNVFGGINFRDLSAVVNKIVVSIPTPRTAQPLVDKDQSERLIHSALKLIPSWKILLRIPVYAGLCEHGTSDKEIETLSHPAAMNTVFRRGAKLMKDKQEQFYYRYYNQEKEMHLCITSVDQISQTIRLANRYNLAGVVIDNLGMEDKRIWSTLQSQFSVGKFL